MMFRDRPPPRAYSDETPSDPVESGLRVIAIVFIVGSVLLVSISIGLVAHSILTAGAPS